MVSIHRDLTDSAVAERAISLFPSNHDQEFDQGKAGRPTVHPSRAPLTQGFQTVIPRGFRFKNSKLLPGTRTTSPSGIRGKPCRDLIPEPESLADVLAWERHGLAGDRSLDILTRGGRSKRLGLDQASAAFSIVLQVGGAWANTSGSGP